MSFIFYSFLRTSDPKPWIQVDFLKSYAIGGVSTQGSFDSDNWVTRYQVYYSNDGQQFLPVPTVAHSDITQNFTGNMDRNTLVTHLFPVVHARYIRIVPLDVSNQPALR